MYPRSFSWWPFVGVLVACSTEPKNPAQLPRAVPEAQQVAADLVVAEAGAASTVARQNADSTEPLASTRTTYQRLQGKWQSTEDSSSVIELKGHLYVDYYAGKRLDSTEFILDAACPGKKGTGHPSDNGKYLVQPTQDMCWEVVGVNEAGLELSYTARGNSLNYRRIK